MSDTYEDAGVSLDKAELIAQRLKQLTGNRFTGSHDIGLSSIIATIDGVGTKSIIGLELGKVKGLGHDLVNHCVNDLLCAGQSVEPFGFLDYIATDNFEVETVLEIIEGMIEACRANDMRMNVLGGETADMPDIYHHQRYDIVGCALGFADNSQLYPKKELGAGNVAVGFYSTGLHTNGFSLVRRTFSAKDYGLSIDGADSLGDAILEPHKSYYGLVKKLTLGGVNITALAHITGGGISNVDRVLPSGCKLVITENWPVPPIFKVIQDRNSMSLEEMARVFNMGIGMVAFIHGDFNTRLLGNEAQVIGFLERDK